MKLDYILNKQIITRISNYTLNYNTIRHVFELFKNIVRFKLNFNIFRGISTFTEYLILGKQKYFV